LPLSPPTSLLQTFPSSSSLSLLLLSSIILLLLYSKSFLSFSSTRPHPLLILSFSSTRPLPLLILSSSLLFSFPSLRTPTLSPSPAACRASRHRERAKMHTRMKFEKIVPDLDPNPNFICLRITHF
jgi:hypothetical protein